MRLAGSGEMVKSQTKSELKSMLMVLGWFVAIFWGLEVVDELFIQHGDHNATQLRFQNCPLLQDGEGSLEFCGIRPRTTAGLLVGIPLAPFLHGGVDHLLGNTLPFLLLGFLTLLRGRAIFFAATVFITIVGGIGTWLLGAENSYHIGASGLIFGYFGFLIMAGVFERSLKAILVAVLVGFAYGGIIWGVLPGTPGVSWEGHLFGLLGGVVASFYLTRGKALA